MTKNIAICVLFVAVICMAAKPEPSVIVLEPQRLQIGNVAVQLPNSMHAYQDKETGNIDISTMDYGWQRCNAATEKMIGLDRGIPVCAPEVVAK